MNRRQRRAAKRNNVPHTATVTAYYDATKGLGTTVEEICRITLDVTDLTTDETVFFKEWWMAKESRTIDEIMDDAYALSNPYNARRYVLEDPVPLEKCPCNCGGYLMNRVTSADLARKEADRREALKRYN
jgi:hypothetical protein